MASNCPLDCYTVLAWWLQDCQWGMRHGLQLATRLLHSPSLVAAGLSMPGTRHGLQWPLDCYTLPAWWLQDCQWGMRHGPQLTGITLLWLVGMNTYWRCLAPHDFMRSSDQWEFPPFFRPHCQSLCTTNFNEILIEIYTFSFKKINLKVSSGKWCPSCLRLNVLILYH